MLIKTNGQRRETSWLKYSTILFLFDFLCIPMFSAGQNRAIILENKNVRFVLDSVYGGLISMTDLTANTEHIHATGAKTNLWTLNFSRGMDKRVVSNTDIPVTTASVTQLPDGSSRATLEWAHIEWAVEKVNARKGVTLGVVSVKVSVDLPKNTGIAAWHISVDNNSDMWGLGDIDFPKVNGFLQAGQYDIAKPWRPGLLYKACTQRIFGEYKGVDMPMQFLTATKNSSSIYMAAHDPQGWWKSFALEPGKDFFIKVYAENMGVEGSDYKDPFPIMFGVYTGGWFEGCKLYRQFALTAPWLAKGKLSQRNDMPQTMKNIGLWFEVGATVKWPDSYPEGVNSPLLLEHLRMQKYFGVPLGFHWIAWPKSVYDTDYPHFFPARDGIVPPLQELVKRGFVIMPHINGRLADTFNDDYAVYNPFATKDPTGKPYIELYGPLRGRMAVMCPYTKFWQDTLSDIVRQLGVRLGSNAAYLDQVCASAPALCYDKSHGHPIGGGHWWVDGYKALLKKVRAAAHENGRDMLIASEETFEQYIDLVDGFYELGYDGRGIPMLSAVYSGYVIHYGSFLNLKENTDRGWKMLNGRSFIWGKQNGWVSFDILKPEYSDRAEYLRTIVKYRVALKKFLEYGELVGTIAHPETITETWDVKHVLSNGTLPVIQGTIWKAEDGSLGIFLANYIDEEKSIDLNIDLSAYGISSKSGKYEISQINTEGKAGKTQEITGKLIRTEKLGPSEIRVLEIKSK